MSDDISLNLSGLEKFTDALSKGFPDVNVGIVGERATIGAYHEFGTSKMPIRSFLRMPMAHLNEMIENSGAFTDALLKECVDGRSLDPWAETVGAIAHQLVLDAFDTEGFGEWKKLKASTLKNKHTDHILIETGQLRNSITSWVD